MTLPLAEHAARPHQESCLHTDLQVASRYSFLGLCVYISPPDPRVTVACHRRRRRAGTTYILIGGFVSVTGRAEVSCLQDPAGSIAAKFRREGLARGCKFICLRLPEEVRNPKGRKRKLLPHTASNGRALHCLVCMSSSHGIAFYLDISHGLRCSANRDYFASCAHGR